MQFLSQALKIAPVLIMVNGVNVAQAEVLNLESGANRFFAGNTTGYWHSSPGRA
ncbi:hypothetical protein KCP73_11835 [Salmonella enterica subsp. enterica]|nr:hypothetical protein KCP73_11835 [Salmonella enterica subsp. enterica]